MTTNEAAEALGLARVTILYQIRHKRIKSTMRGRDHWITAGEVERYRRDSLGQPGRPASHSTSGTGRGSSPR
jgi:excisionase family DNA binding protein